MKRINWSFTLALKSYGLKLGLVSKVLHSTKVKVGNVSLELWLELSVSVSWFYGKIEL